MTLDRRALPARESERFKSQPCGVDIVGRSDLRGLVVVVRRLAILLAVALTLGLVGPAGASASSPSPGLQGASPASVGRPGKPSLSKVTAKKVTVSWKRVRGAARYEVRVGKKIRATKKLALRVAAKPGAQVRVRALSADGARSTWSKPRRKPPVVVKKVKVTPLGTSKARVTWRRSKGAKSYQLRIGKKIVKTKALTRSLRVDAATAIRVRAIGVKGTKGAWSKARYRAPNAPKSVAVRATGTYEGFVAFTLPTGATEAQVRVGTYVTTVKSGSASLWMEFKDPVRVRVKGKGGWSPWTDPVLKPLSSSERIRLQDERSRLELRVAELRADVAIHDAEIAKLNYQLMVATDYGDTDRVQQIQEELAFEHAARKTALARIHEHTTRIAEIGTTLTEADALEP